MHSGPDQNLEDAGFRCCIIWVRTYHLSGKHRSGEGHFPETGRLCKRLVVSKLSVHFHDGLKNIDGGVPFSHSSRGMWRHARHWQTVSVSACFASPITRQVACSIRGTRPAGWLMSSPFPFKHRRGCRHFRHPMGECLFEVPVSGWF